MEMILNNRTLSASEALQVGLVNRVVPAERFLEESLILAAEIAARAPLALAAGKQAVLAGYDLSLSEALALERELFYTLFDSLDQKEGMRAFIEKRKAGWVGM
jgi:enoyl-CoA hydratase